ncbi:MATE family efflux transporter [Paracoccus pacificus]|uniref:MATE family efflux transporter n=1 Tax=Paracoccus pacificus TaxID=1463598 RepID=A0ABW4R8J2_9RHOB
MAPPFDVPLWRRFLVFLLPLMAQNILQSLSITINNIFVGRILGVEALAAASVFFPVAFFFIAFLIGLSAGASVLIGQAYGAKKPDLVKRITGTTLTVALIGGIIIGGIGAILAPRIMALLGTPAEILPQASEFARANFAMMPFIFLFLVGSSLLRGVGDTVRPLMTQAVATCISAALTPVMILWLGLGVKSATLAQGIAYAVSTVGLGFWLRRIGHQMAPDQALFEHLKPDWHLLKTVLRVGLPTGVQVVVGSLSALVIVGLINGFGYQAAAAYGAVSQVQSYVQFPALSIAIAASIFGAQMIGSGRADRLDEVLRTAMMMNLVLTGTLVGLVYLFSGFVVGLFITDQQVVDTAQHLLHIITWASLMFGAGTIFSGIMRASGTVWIPMCIGIFCVMGIELPTATILSRVLGLEGIWWGYVASFGAMMCLQGLFYFAVWRKKTVHALV